MVVKQLGEPMVAQITRFEANGRPWFVLQEGPEFMIFKSDWGCGDDGDGESGPMPYNYEKPYEQVAGGVGGPHAEDLLRTYLAEDELEAAIAEHVHDYQWKKCGAKVCGECRDHQGLARCHCGWARDGGDGYRQLEEMGEQIEDDY